jgi:CcmD family protein
MIFRGILIVFIFVFFAIGSVFGQGMEMADVMRSNGKIYVVVGVILIIFSGILLYLFQTGRKLKDVEERLREIEEKT